MFNRLRSAIESERKLSVDSRTHLVDGLFHPFASFITGVVIGFAITYLIWQQSSDPVLMDFSILLSIVAVGRLCIGAVYLRQSEAIQKENVYRWEWAFSIGAVAFSLCLGLLAFLAITRHMDFALDIILSVTCVGYGSIIAARNAGRPWLALAQLYCSTVPVWLGLGLQDGLDPVISNFGWTGLILYTVGVSDITLGMRETFITLLESKLENEKLAKENQEQVALLKATLTNMSHGLCMFDEDRQLLVWNEKAAQIIGLDMDVFQKHAPISDILQAFLPDDQLKILQQIDEGKGKPSEFGDTLQLSDGRYVARSVRTMEDGHIVIVFADVTEKELAQARIKNLAWVDQLTGLLNRVSVHEHLIKVLDEMHETAEIAVHYIDLDHFKSVNDTLGHPIGDMLLKQVADRINDVCLDEGQVARMAGDEFLIVQKLSPQARAPRDLAQQVVDALNQPFTVNSHFIRIGASVGVVIAPKDGKDADLLLKRADMALYAAKRSGRNKYAYFEPQMDQRLQQVRALELDIKQALDKNQFKLAFQPIFDSQNGEISNFECLARWTHPVNGKMLPSKFVPVAEETGQIIDIGRWVTKEAIRVASRWPVRKQISVNFSAIQFQDSRFPQYLNSQLRRFKFPPELIELEITETAFIVDLENSLKQLEQLKKLGVKISLDDFGTGYTSLSQLQRFAFDKIKIDGSFIKDIDTNPSSLAVATAIAEIGKALHISVVAECVETQRQLDVIKAAGVTHIQGYFTGKPVSSKEAEAMLLEHKAQTEQNMDAVS